MNRLLLVIAGLSLWGCVITPNFEPATLEGAKCKQQCAQAMQMCQGSSYTCDRSYAKCLEACMDIERVTVKSEK